MQFAVPDDFWRKSCCSYSQNSGQRDDQASSAQSHFRVCKGSHGHVFVAFFKVNQIIPETESSHNLEIQRGRIAIGEPDTVNGRRGVSVQSG